MSIARTQINTFITIRNFAGISVQTRNHTERKPNLRKPKDPDHNKKLLLTLIEPFYAKDRRPDSVKCQEWNAQRYCATHPYIRILSEDCEKDLKSKYIYLFHLNYFSNRNFNELRKDFLRKDIYLRNYPIEAIKLAIENSRLSNLYEFFRHYGCFASSQVEKLDDIVKLCKENDRIILMGAVIDNQILSVKQLQDYSKSGGIDAVRAQLCHTLSIQSSQLSSTLDYHSNELAFNLNSYVEKDTKNELKSSGDQSLENST